jgi:hypothetical protein
LYWTLPPPLFQHVGGRREERSRQIGENETFGIAKEMEERIPLKREKRTLRGNPEIDEGDEEDSGKNSRIGEERVDKERHLCSLPFRHG